MQKRQRRWMSIAMSILALFGGLNTSHAAGPTSRPASLGASWGDLGDGTFANPILPGDYSDIDAIRVGDDYYAISSTFHYSPGMIVLHSRDLVNWEIIGHAIGDISHIAPQMNWDAMDRYGRGVWAGAIRHHDGKFWVYFGTPDEGFFVTTATHHYSPGMIVLHSRDLVNWEIIGHAIGDISHIAPQMNWDAMDRYGRGVWAGAIRHHDGKFWVYFGTPDEGFFVTTATHPAGPWEPVQPVMKAKGWDDGCPFWDDDGQGYFVATNFAEGYKIKLFKLTADGKGIVPGWERDLYSSKGSEASKLYKMNGVYYHYFSEVHSGRRDAMMRRARHLDGPWETRQLNRVDKAIDREPNQGGLIQTPAGEWWFVTHQGSAAWEGRTMALLPVTWVDGWPIIGKVESDGVGTMVWQGKKPIANLPTTRPQSNDEFASETLAPQWEWNYQPRQGKWSLTERPGFLRMHSFKALKPDDLSKVGNLLTQRSMKTIANDVTICMDVSGMKDGDAAGLSHFARVFATIGVSQRAGVRYITSNDRGHITDGPAVNASTIYLRSTWGMGGLSQFAYSMDGKSFTPFGASYQLTWQSYRGDRTGIFHYNRDREGGYVDVDWYHYHYARPGASAAMP